MRKYAVETIGTFFLVFTIVMAVNNAGPLAPLAIGASLMVMIYAGGHISGAHFNPAVSVAAYIRGRLELTEMLYYWGAQVIGATLAGLIGAYVVNKPDDAPSPVEFTDRAITNALIVELLFTFALAWVILNVATSKDHPDNSFYGLAIGFTVAAGAFAVGPVSGGAFNPAVGLGGAIGEVLAWENLWIYVLAPVLGGALAGFAFKALNPDDV